MSKIACVLTSYFEDVEYTEPAKALKDAGHEVTVISSESGQQIDGKQGEASVSADKRIEDVSADEFDAIFIPGGFSPDILRGDYRFVTFTKEFVYAQKPVLAICHGPQLLITADVLKGRRITGFKSIQMDLKHAGANVFDKQVVVCGNLVTSRQPDDIAAFNEASLNVLKEQVSTVRS